MCEKFGSADSLVAANRQCRFFSVYILYMYIIYIYIYIWNPRILDSPNLRIPEFKNHWNLVKILIVGSRWTSFLGEVPDRRPCVAKMGFASLLFRFCLILASFASLRPVDAPDVELNLLDQLLTGLTKGAHYSKSWVKSFMHP